MVLGQFMGTHSVDPIILRIMGLMQFLVMGVFVFASWKRIEEAPEEEAYFGQPNYYR
jgi:hypothetical protein